MGERFIYQDKLPGWQAGELGKKEAVIIGCGALGSNLAEELARLGLGRLLLIDPDVVAESNLHRVSMYTEADIGSPKVAVAKAHLRQINSRVKVAICQLAADADNLPDLLKGADVVLDGLDNMTARAALNKICYQKGIPWVYGGVLATSGMVLPIIPGKTACLNCLLPNLGQQEPPTTKEAGILPTLPRLVAAYQVTAALKILFGGYENPPRLLTIDPWNGEAAYLQVCQSQNCPTCGQKF